MVHTSFNGFVLESAATTTSTATTSTTTTVTTHTRMEALGGMEMHYHTGISSTWS